MCTTDMWHTGRVLCLLNQVLTNKKDTMKKLATFSFRKKRKNRIIVFANQKGGVGKSTLCVSYCNRLAETSRPFVLIDSDPQRTISKMREKDEGENPELMPRYNIYRFSGLDDVDKTVDFMNDARDRDCDVIIDSPGSLSKEGMKVLLMKADIIICPTQFDKGTVLSTIAFIKFVKQTAEELGLEKHPPIVFVVNRYNRNWGRSDELAVWRKTEKTFAEYGEIAPKVAAVADMGRYSTLYITPKQKETVKPFFDFVNQLAKKTA